MSSVDADFFTQGRNMLNLQEIKERMQDRNVAAVARIVGINKATLYRILSNESQPTYETVRLLSDYLETGRAPGKDFDGTGGAE